MQVQIGNRQARIKLNPRRIKKIAEEALKKLGCTDQELSLLLVDDQQITELNRQYLGRKKPTDVLAFPMNQEKLSPLHPHLLGDVVISLDQAVAQARRLRHSLDEELLVLLLHGLLHLLGYDHTGSAREAKRMRAMERRLFLELKRFLPLVAKSDEN